MSDAASGFELVMPAAWSVLRPGDAAWVEIYGDHDSYIENDVKSGVIQDFALPLRSDDARLLSLAVYVRPVEPQTSLNDLADAYEQPLTMAVLNGYGPGEMVDRRTVGLSAGTAVRLESTLPYTGVSDPGEPAAPGASLPTLDDHVVAYVLLHAGQGYYLVFRGNVSIMGRHTEEFACMADSLRFTTDEPT